MNIPMIDTLVATIDIKDYENTAKYLINILENKKNEAKLVAANSASDKILIDIGNLTFQVLQNGAKGYAYILHNDSFEVKIAKYRSKKQEFYPIFIKIKSETLWAIGPEMAWKLTKEWINDYIGEVIDNKISRVDLCCHTDEIELNLLDIETFKGRFNIDQIIRERRQITGLNLGSRSSRKVYCRIYDKVREVNKKQKKLWFYDIWTEKGLDINNVWNIEFEVNREFFKEYGIDTVEDTFMRIKSIWEYCTKEWLVKVDLDRTRIERCSVNSTWENVQDAFKNYESKNLVKREKQLNADALAMVPGAIGNITSYAARKGISDINQILLMLRKEGKNYLERAKDMDYKEIIDKKMAIIT